MKKYFSLFLLCIAFAVNAQVANTSELYNVMQKMDSLLFTEGFNNCNYNVLEQILTTDLEFYHDEGGVQNKEQFITATKNNICNSAYGKISRKLVAGSMQVFTMEDKGVLYGILQNGEHEFYIQKPGKEVVKTGWARFSCLWVLQNKEWKLKRVFSFDHKAAE